MLNVIFCVPDAGTVYVLDDEAMDKPSYWT
jgi:hypothetical protein